MLGVDDIAPTTAARYNIQLQRLDILIGSLGSSSLNELLRDQAYSAIIIWVTLCMQLGFDSGKLGVSDAGNLLSALSRHLNLASRTGRQMSVGLHLPVQTGLQAPLQQ